MRNSQIVDQFVTSDNVEAVVAILSVDDWTVFILQGLGNLLGEGVN